MAFVADTDLAPKPIAVPAPVVAHRSKLVPILLITLNVGVLAVLGAFFAPKLGLSLGSGDSPAIADISALDQKLLVTRDGGRLNPVVFGNLIFEVTRVAYYSDVRSRTVTITVPGTPPESALFRVGDSFAGGRIRVVEILPSGVILECAGKQQAFGLLGSPADASEAAPSSTGLHVIPARSTHVVPDLLPGQTRPPEHPLTDQPAKDQPTKEAGGGIESFDELPEYFVVLDREEFRNLVRTLPDIIATDIVFAPARERETKAPLGIEIKNIKPECILAKHGMRTGDIVMYFNGEDIRRVADLDLAVRSLQSAEEISIEFRRDGEQLLFILQLGVPEDAKPAEPERPAPRRG
jgi:type II secretory pathway component PulC